jgi:hypothetical protein
MGYSTTLIYEPQWRIGRSSVECLSQKVAAGIVDMDPDAVVLQLLDNSCYYGRTRDGSRTAQEKGEDKKYQVEGEVTVFSHDTQLEHLKAISEILDAIGKRKCLLITPLPRYVTAGCWVLPGSGTLLKQEVPGFQAALAELTGSPPKIFQGLPVLQWEEKC